MNVVVSEKGQVTIPEAICEDLGLVPGTVLDLTEEGGCLVARKVVAQSPITAWRGRGKLPEGRSVDEYLRIVREGE